MAVFRYLNVRRFVAECAWDIQNLMVAVEAERRVERGGQSSPHAPHRAAPAALLPAHATDQGAPVVQGQRMLRQ